MTGRTDTIAYCRLLLIGVMMSAANGQSCKGVEAQLAAANDALQRSDVADAERHFTSLQASSPDCQEVLLGLGRVQEARRQYRAAYEFFSRYAQLVPQDARGYAALGNIALAIGRPDQAEALSVKAISVDPNNVEALILRGQILGLKKESSRAEEMLARACELAPDNPQAHFELGVLYDRLQRNGKAVEEFEKVVRLSPTNPRAYDYLALNLEASGQFAKVDAAYRKGVDINQGPLMDAFLDYNYGRFLMKMNRLDEAALRLDRALEQAPDTRAIYYERAKLNEKLGKMQQARLDAEKALQLKDPAGVIVDLQVYYLLVRVYTRLGEKELAAQYTQLTQTSAAPLRTRMGGAR